MGNCHPFFKKQRLNVTILVVGLDNAGKTTISKVLQKQSINAIAPTVGYSSHEFKFRNFLVTMIDVGGGSKIRAIWKNYFAEVYGVIYVVDSSDHKRINESKTELAHLLSNRLISGKPVLLLANKQDCHDALDEVDVVEQLNLEAVVNEYKCLCKMEMTTGILGKKDTSIKNGLTWLLSVIEQNFMNLKHRVEKDVKEQNLQIEEELAAKRERIQQRKNTGDSRGCNASSELIKSKACEEDVEKHSTTPKQLLNSGLENKLENIDEKVIIPGSIPDLKENIRK